MADRLRQIMVDGRPFRWRFDGVLVVIPGDHTGPQLVVDWEWRDWLEPDGPGDEPLVVTPGFVAAAVQFGLDHGWQPTGGGPPVRLGFQNGAFTVAREDA